MSNQTIHQAATKLENAAALLINQSDTLETTLKRFRHSHVLRATHFVGALEGVQKRAMDARIVQYEELTEKVNKLSEELISLNEALLSAEAAAVQSSNALTSLPYREQPECCNC